MSTPPQIEFEKHIESAKPHIVTFLNPYSYLIARDNLDTFKEFHSLNIDGKLLCLAFKLIGRHKQRISFDMTSLAPVVFDHANKNSLSIFLVGGEPGIAEQAAGEIRSKYTQIKFSGFQSGFFKNEEERNAAIIDIANSSADIVICGMGTPLQEKFLVDLVNYGWKGLGYTCGGFLEQTSRKGLHYYPDSLNKLDLRWLYRIIEDPKLFKRYLLKYPQFFTHFIYDILKTGKHKQLSR
ncbi:WecB/TagA/CpsF family glycosyltransferase [Pseudomonas sp. abacavir_1]